VVMVGVVVDAIGALDMVFGIVGGVHNGGHPFRTWKIDGIRAVIGSLSHT
jgi:hypothetical protein